MHLNYFVGDRQETTIRTIGTLDLRFFADAADPLVSTSWRVAGSICLAAFEPARIDILPSAKQGPEELDLRYRSGTIGDRRVARTRRGNIRRGQFSARRNGRIGGHDQIVAKPLRGVEPSKGCSELRLRRVLTEKG